MVALDLVPVQGCPRSAEGHYGDLAARTDATAVGPPVRAIVPDRQVRDVWADAPYHRVRDPPLIWLMAVILVLSVSAPGCQSGHLPYKLPVLSGDLTELLLDIGARVTLAGGSGRRHWRARQVRWAGCLGWAIGIRVTGQRWASWRVVWLELPVLIERHRRVGS